MPKYDRAVANRFVIDMEVFGLDPTHYKGRNHWEGPAVSVDRKRLADVKNATKVNVVEETLGKNFVIVHPVVPAKLKGK